MQKLRSKYWRWQKVFKGAANHRRLEIMELLDRSSNISLTEIALLLRLHLKTAGEHTRKLVLAGLVDKYSDGKNMRHHLTALGKNVLKFCRILE